MSDLESAGDERQPDALAEADSAMLAILAAEGSAGRLSGPQGIAECAVDSAVTYLHRRGLLPAEKRGELERRGSLGENVRAALAAVPSVARAPELDVGDGDSVTDQFLVTITTAGDSPAISESDLAGVLGEVDQVPECGQWAFHIRRLPAESVARASEPTQPEERAISAEDASAEVLWADPGIKRVVLDESARASTPEDEPVRAWINREHYDFKKRLTTGAKLRKAASIPDDMVLWREGRTPTEQDVGVPEGQGFVLLQDDRFYSSPRLISPGRASTGTEDALREALNFYADEGNYFQGYPRKSRVGTDMGTRARAALAAARPVEDAPCKCGHLAKDHAEDGRGCCEGCDIGCGFFERPVTGTKEEPDA